MERVPADVADPEIRSKAARLARDFVEHDPWAKSQSGSFDLDELVERVAKFARGRGYPVEDEPPGCYPATPARWVTRWGPPEK